MKSDIFQLAVHQVYLNGYQTILGWFAFSLMILTTSLICWNLDNKQLGIIYWILKWVFLAMFVSVNLMVISINLDNILNPEWGAHGLISK